MKKGRYIEVGDQFTVDTGEEVKVRTVSKGMLPRHLHVEFSNGDWSEIGFDAFIKEYPEKEGHVR